MSEKINAFLCGEGSKIGDAAEKLVGDATACWCCSFFRGVLVGSIATLIVASVVVLLLP